MQVRIVAYIGTSERKPGHVLHTLELSPFEIPRKDDILHFPEGNIYAVHHVTWKYETTSRVVVLAPELPPGTVSSTKLVGVDIHV